MFSSVFVIHKNFFDNKNIPLRHILFLQCYYITKTQKPQSLCIRIAVYVWLMTVILIQYYFNFRITIFRIRYIATGITKTKESTTKKPLRAKPQSNRSMPKHKSQNSSIDCVLFMAFFLKQLTHNLTSLYIVYVSHSTANMSILAPLSLFTIKNIIS